MTVCTGARSKRRNAVGPCDRHLAAPLEATQGSRRLQGRPGQDRRRPRHLWRPRHAGHDRCATAALGMPRRQRRRSELISAPSSSLIGSIVTRLCQPLATITSDDVSRLLTQGVGVRDSAPDIAQGLPPSPASERAAPHATARTGSTARERPSSSGVLRALAGPVVAAAARPASLRPSPRAPPRGSPVRSTRRAPPDRARRNGARRSPGRWAPR